jgi:riboflavin kinase/FMN adenylyltransferase
VKVWRGLDELLAPESGTSIAIGTFDGVHLGHRALIAGALEPARERGLLAAVVTWDRHPAATVRPDKVPPLLTSQDRKLELLGETGIDIVAVVPFDEGLSLWSPERFVDEVIVAGLNAKLVRVGHDWRFGHKAAGDTDLLEKLGAEHGFEIDAVTLEESGAEPVTSTRTRAAIAAGDMVSATALLARPFDVDGVVVRGDGRGATLGFPTANLDIDPALARPAQGVYAGRMRIGDRWYRAAVNVGKNLTFGGETVRVEAYVLDFDADLYGRTVRLEFHHRLRDELKFDSVDDLVARMHDDVAQTRSLIPDP